MSEQPGYSPSFKRPSDTLRLRRKRARSEGVGSGRPHSSTSPGISLSGVRPYSPGPSLNGQPRSVGVKRRNPFASLENTYSSPKRRAVAPGERDAGSLGCKLLNEAEGEKRVQDPARQGALQFSEGILHAEKRSQDASEKEQTSVSEDDSLFEDHLFSEEKISPSILTNLQGSGSSEVAPPLCTEFPADWSLKTRLLFTSPLSFSWAEHLKAQEEAQGLSQHCRAAHIPLPQNIQDAGSSWELRCCLSQALQLWQHPSLPWLQLFPRMNAERSFSGKSAPWSQDPVLQQSLRNEWAGSFTSLYSLLKARLCPYFYVCSYQFTALFRASGFSGAGDITAVLSPTTRGLREAMRSEGIEFTLPLLAGKRKCKGRSSTRQERGEHTLEPRGVADDDEDDEDEVCGEGDDEDDEDDEDGGLSWLREMGVEDKIQQPDSISIRLRKELSEVRSDRRAESMVLVRGSAHTFTLLNFLINCRSVVAAAGSQCGLPPTLLSPTPFRGATLHTLRARSVKVKTRVGSGFQDVSSLEVTGPVLPHALHTLTLLLRPAQRGNFSATLYPHEPTAVFNTPVGPETVPLAHDAAPQGLEGCGLSTSTVQQLLQPSTLGQGALRQLHLREHCYSWRS